MSRFFAIDNLNIVKGLSQTIEKIASRAFESDIDPKEFSYDSVYYIFPRNLDDDMKPWHKVYRHIMEEGDEAAFSGLNKFDLHYIGKFCPIERSIPKIQILNEEVLLESEEEKS